MWLHKWIEILAYSSFLIMGLLSLLPKKETLTMKESGKDSFMQKIANCKLNYCLIIALCIMVGELGDKTFLASIGLGIGYPHSKISLVIGAILAMVVCDYIAILFGKFLNKHISENAMKKLSGVLFLIFGVLGFASIG